MINWDSPSWGTQDTTWHHSPDGSWVVTTADEDAPRGRE